MASSLYSVLKLKIEKCTTQIYPKSCEKIKVTSKRHAKKLECKEVILILDFWHIATPEKKKIPKMKIQNSISDKIRCNSFHNKKCIFQLFFNNSNVLPCTNLLLNK